MQKSRLRVQINDAFLEEEVARVLLIIVGVVFYMGLAGGIGWKYFGEMGFLIGASLAFISCLFSKNVRGVLVH